MRAPSKYSAVTMRLSSIESDREEMSFDTIEKLIGSKLPASARAYRPWWGNDLASPSRQCSAWQQAGWRVKTVDLTKELVVFVRQ